MRLNSFLGLIIVLSGISTWLMARAYSDKEFELAKEAIAIRKIGHEITSFG